MLFYLLLFDPHGQVLIQHLSLVFPESYPVTFCVRKSGRREAVGCNKDNYRVSHRNKSLVHSFPYLA